MRSIKFGLGLAVVVLAAALARAAEPKDEFFEASDGIKIHYITLGDQGSWVVMIHGASDSAKRMWFDTGIAAELAKSHRVLGIDCRGHGQSGSGGTSTSAKDVLELMTKLKIDKAHIQGYSMGGGITSQLLASNPEKFITAGFGGSGIRETDTAAAAKASELDAAEMAKAPAGAAKGGAKGAKGGGKGVAKGGKAKAGGDGKTAAKGTDGAKTADAKGTGAKGGGARGGAGGARPAIDLAKLTVPIIFINGSLDSPHSRSSRVLREKAAGVFKPDVKEVILDGKNHFTAIMVGGPMPKEYIDEVAKFINSHDIKP